MCRRFPACLELSATGEVESMCAAHAVRLDEVRLTDCDWVGGVRLGGELDGIS